METTDYNDFDIQGSGDEKQFNSGHILMVDPIKFPDEFDVKLERKKRKLRKDLRFLF